MTDDSPALILAGFLNDTHQLLCRCTIVSAAFDTGRDDQVIELNLFTHSIPDSDNRVEKVGHGFLTEWIARSVTRNCGGYAWQSN